MRKIFIVLIGLLSVLSLFAEKIPEYKASNGIVYHVGDTIKLGRGSAPNGDFNYLQMGGMYNAMVATGGGGQMASSVGRNYSGLNVILKKIKETKFKGGKKVIFVVGGGNITNYNLMIEDAIASGEVDCPKKEVMQQEASKDDKVTKLKELKQLLDDGILSQEEFNTEKKKILDEINNF